MLNFCSEGVLLTTQEAASRARERNDVTVGSEAIPSV